jgi:hypothetical protein
MAIEGIAEVFFEILELKSVNLNVQTIPTPITLNPTYASILVIQNNSGSVVYFGPLGATNLQLPANGGVFTITMPLGKKIDLSKLFLVSTTNVTVTVMYA